MAGGKSGGHCADVQAPDSGKQQHESEENRCNSDERLKSRRHRERIVLFVKLSCTVHHVRADACHCARTAARREGRPWDSNMLPILEEESHASAV